jgi:electron transfer flavoprotein beta subunit
VNILVFIKQVADTEARISLKSDKRSLEIENKYNMNFFDEFAVEEALKVKSKIKDSQITVCTYGAKKAVEALRTAIAMGADKAFLLDNTGLDNDDPLITSKILANFAKNGGFDLIFCGRQAIDDENANIGTMVAGFLDIPHVSAILKFDIIDEKKVVVESEIEGGKATLEVELPALFTTQKGINEPRVPLITGVMKAMKASINVIDPVTLGLSKDIIDTTASKISVLTYETPAGRPAVKIVDGETTGEKVKSLINILKEDAKVL